MAKKPTLQEARSKIERYCAYQERHHQEVRSKLYSYGLFQNDVEEMIASLIVSGFLNEERFAKAYAGGKFRMKKWGRMKIENALQSKGISPNCIRSGLKEIDEKDYLSTLRELLQQKWDLIPEPNIYVRRDRVSKYAIAKGYEPERVWQMIRELFPD